MTLMAVENDRFELPIGIYDTIKAVAEFYNVGHKVLMNGLHQNHNEYIMNDEIKIVKVEA
jgi:hypothetical protein